MGNKSTKLHVTRVLPYGVADLYHLIATVKEYGNFLPGCKQVIIHHETDHEIMAELIIGYKFFKESFTSRVLLTPLEKIEIEYIKGPFKHLHHYWKFKPIGAGETQVEFFIDFEFQSKIFQKAIEGVFAHSSDIIMAAFESRLKRLIK